MMLRDSEGPSATLFWSKFRRSSFTAVYSPGFSLIPEILAA
jgi:hypothetical protein